MCDLRIDAGGYLQVSDYVPAEQCAAWRDAVLAHRHLWVRRRHDFSFRNAWYLDLECGVLHEYHAMAAAANDILEKTLPGFVSALAGVARYLVGPDGETDLPARPRRDNLGPYWCDAGVHIMGGMHGFRYTGGGPHADYEGLSPYVPALFDDRTRAYSAILSLATPADGIGLDVWTNRRYTADVARTAEERALPPVSLEYGVGRVTTIDSFLYHRLQQGAFGPDGLWRIVGIVHFLYRADPYPHWEHWF
jgi:hypothetical protein